jgi:YD repeat-containing protein
MSGLHFDAKNRLVQFDGFEFDDIDLVRTSTVIEYDGEDRVVRTSNWVRQTTVAYAPGEAIESNGLQTIRYELDDAGRMLRLLVGNQASVTYEYDALGRVVRFARSGGTDTRFTYDAEGRITSRSNAEKSTQIAYTQSGPELDVRETDAFGTMRHWKIHVDAAGRTDRVDDVTHDSTLSYTYGPDVIEEFQFSQTTARGHCPAPTVGFAPSLYIIGRPEIDRGLAFPRPLFDGMP